MNKIVTIKTTLHDYIRVMKKEIVVKKVNGNIIVLIDGECITKEDERIPYVRSINLHNE